MASNHKQSKVENSRYERLLSLSGFSDDFLNLLQEKKILIIGAGGVGQHVALYLATNGVHNLTLVDFDMVELSNLNRQVLLTENDVGKTKVEVVKRNLRNRNKELKINVYCEKIDQSNANLIIDLKYDFVVDALDNWEGKLLINDICKKKNIPFLHIGVDGTSGQYCIFNNKSLRDIVSNDILNERRDGVMGPMVGAISSLASLHLIKFLIGQESGDTLYSFSQEQNQFQKIKI